MKKENGGMSTSKNLNLKRGGSDEDAERIAAQLLIKLRTRRTKPKVYPFLKFDAKTISSL